jgi:hypothetical protein
MSIHWRHRSKNAPVNLASLRVTKVRRFQEPRTADFGKSEIEGSILVADSWHSWKEPVNALPKVVGFLRVLRFPLTENVDKVDWD